LDQAKSGLKPFSTSPFLVA